MKRNKNQIVDLMRKKPVYLTMGAGKLARRFKTDIETIKEAKRIAKEMGTIPDSKARILLLDIEVAPTAAYIWSTQTWNIRVTSEAIISKWFVLTWAAKWLGSKTCMSMKITSEETKTEDDSRIVQGLWNLMDQADIIVAHNGDKYDLPHLNTRFLLHGFSPPSPYRTIDTLRVARKQFAFQHNSLGAIGGELGFGGKYDVGGLPTWKKARKGDVAAIDKMDVYNVEDVYLLEKVYLRFRPWIRNHPNVGMYTHSNESCCANCGSEDLKEMGGKFYYTNTARYSLYQCQDPTCGAINKERRTNLDREKAGSLVTSLTRLI